MRRLLKELGLETRAIGNRLSLKWVPGKEGRRW